MYSYEYYHYYDVPSIRYYSQATIKTTPIGPTVTTPIVTGTWEQIGKAWAYKENNVYVINSWKQIKGKWYYFNELGFMVTGWRGINGKTYYFNGNGEMVTGALYIDGILRTFAPDGA